MDNKKREELITKLVNLAYFSPQEAARRIASAGSYDKTTEYLLDQEIHNRVLQNPDFGKERAGMFAEAVSRMSGLKLACR